MAHFQQTQEVLSNYYVNAGTLIGKQGAVEVLRKQKYKFRYIPKRPF